jgi:signal transduction histidine kinase
MGFGLAICQRIIEAHKGKIFIQSTLGKGTTVIIELPTKQ